jgi:hypothetical protein
MGCRSTRGSVCTSASAGEIVGSATAAMRVVGSVADWEQWAGMALPESGSYVVPGALVPLKVDRDRDVGEDLEPACWVRHRVPRS